MIEKAYNFVKCLKTLTPNEYWNKHTVSGSFNSYEESMNNYNFVCETYHNYKKHSGLSKPEVERYNDKTVLVYGCGTGVELVPILENSTPARVVAVDISDKALNICKKRIEFHKNNYLVELMRVSEDHIFEQEEFDYVVSLGVLHHIPNMVSAFKNISNAVKKGGSMRIMLYNEDSIYFHLSIGFVRQILKNIDKRYSTQEAFRRSSEHGNCPCSYIVKPEFVPVVAQHIGCDAKLVGMSLYKGEIEDFYRFYDLAMSDKTLSVVHKAFLNCVTNKLLYNGNYAGLDMFWELTKK
jgi:2-polyprenyl-3-methyl-5-hydroxy-6-metoxy-1,4-benzoquinol methylase